MIERRFNFGKNDDFGKLLCSNVLVQNWSVLRVHGSFRVKIIFSGVCLGLRIPVRNFWFDLTFCVRKYLTCKM